MSCRNTYPLYNKRGKFIGMSSCGECPYCRLKRSSELSFYSYCASMDSYRLGLSNYFYTLTYTDYHLPVNDRGIPTVSMRDLVLFKKSFFEKWNRHFKNIRPKILCTTEYGGVTNRPHIHFLLYGVPDKYTSEVVYDSWKSYGEINLGVLQSGGSYYLTKYCSTTPTKEVQKILYDDNQIERPHLSHSPFSDSRTLRELVATSLDHNLCHNLNGYPSPLPAYIRRKVDPFGVIFDKYRYLQDFKNRLKNLGMNEQQYNDMLYRRYVIRCQKQGIPVVDENSKVKKDFVAYQKQIPSALASKSSALDVMHYYQSVQKNLVTT